MTIIEEIVQYDEITEEAGGGVNQVNGNVGGKHIATIEGYFYRAATGKYLQFNPDGTVENINELDGETWADLGFVAGATITFEGTASNNVTTTITTLTDTILTTPYVFVDETVEDVTVYDDTPVTCVDFYYNLIENSEEENYFSRVDSGAVQRFSSVGYDLTGEIGNAQNMLVASESFGWVTNTLDDEDTGETSQVRITNVETVDHKQYFLINHIYYITPYCLVDQKTNFDNLTPPYSYLRFTSGQYSLHFNIFFRVFIDYKAFEYRARIRLLAKRSHRYIPILSEVLYIVIVCLCLRFKLDETGDYILDEDGQRIEEETCA